MNRFRALKYPNNQAFTLIELIVVISVISVLLAFALPRLDASFFSDKERKLSTWILLNVKSLKEQAVQEQALLVLNIDFDNDQIWSSVGPMTEETPKANEIQLPSGYELMDVQFANKEKISSGVAEIYFYQKGYSDKALIHIREDDNQYSYLIESFLPHVKIFEEYIEF